MPAILAAELKPLADRFLDGLSVDQRRQAHQAMSFARGTDWLLLEEPLAALDMAHARRPMHERADLSDGGKSVVMVLHEVNHAAAWADHVVAGRTIRIVAAMNV